MSLVGYLKMSALILLKFETNCFQKIFDRGQCCIKKICASGNTLVITRTY